MLQFQIGKEIHLPFSNPVFDFDFLPDVQDPTGEEPDAEKGNKNRGFRKTSEHEVRAILAAVPAEVVERIRQACEQADVELAAIEIKGASILRALKAMERIPDGNLALMEFSADRMEAHFYQSGVLVFTRTLEVVPEKYVASTSLALAETVEEPQQQASGEPKGFEMGHDWSLVERMEMADHFENMVIEMALQIDRFMNFFIHSLPQGDGQAVSNLWLAGHVPAPERLLTQLTARFDGMNIEVVQVPYVVHRSHISMNQGSGKDARFSLSALGAALKGGVSDAN